MAKAKGFTRRYSPLNPAPATEIELDDDGQTRILVTTTLLKPLAELLGEMRSVARELLRKEGIESAQDFNNDTFLNIMNHQGESVDERHRKLASLPDPASFAFQLDSTLDVLDSELSSGETEGAARAALFVGILAERLHTVPWEKHAINGYLAYKWKQLPVAERQRRGATRGQKKRWLAHNQMVGRWEELAKTLWQANPKLAKKTVARRIAADLGGNVETIRHRIAKLKPRSGQ